MKRLFVLIIAVMITLSACGSVTKSKTEQQSVSKDKATTSNGNNTPSRKTSTEANSSDKSKLSENSANNSNVTKVTDKPKEVKPSYKIDSKTWSVVPLNPSNKKKVVLITIDDAPDKHALDMAKTLKALNVSGIFFVNGIYLKGNQKANELKQIKDMGFMIGNHTETHPNLSKLSAAKQKKEIQSVTERVKAVTGVAPVFFRAPFGVNTDVTRKEVKDEGMVLMNWSYGYDWKRQYENKESLTKIMLNTPYLHNGAILLMHDHPWTAAALKDIILGLKKKGYDMVNPNDIQTLQTQR